jgi:DNA-binding Xre family transcriptional regulator
MAYKLIVFDKVKESKYTFIEVKAKIGLSRSKLEGMQRKNDAKFSDLYAIATLLECELKDLYIEGGEFANVVKSKTKKHQLRLERQAEICDILNQHFPEDITKLRQVIKISETDVCNRLWDNRFGLRAYARVARLTGDDAYLQSVIDKVSKLKDNLNKG